MSAISPFSIHFQVVGNAEPAYPKEMNKSITDSEGKETTVKGKEDGSERERDYREKEMTGKSKEKFYGRDGEKRRN